MKTLSSLLFTAQGIDPIAQIILAIGVVTVVVLLMLIIYKRGIKAGKTGVNIPGREGECVDSVRFQSEDFETLIDLIFKSLKDIVDLNDDKRLERKMIYVETKLVIIRGMKERLFYKLLKDSGVSQDDLTSHVDAVYFVQVLNNALYYDNGEQCMKTLFRRALRGEEYRDFDDLSAGENHEKYVNFVESFFRSSLEKWKRFFYDNYKTEIVDQHGNSIQRRITNENIYDMDFLEDHLQELKKIYYSIFDYARQVDSRIDKEKESLFKARKEDIRKLFTIVPKEGD